MAFFFYHPKHSHIKLVIRCWLKLQGFFSILIPKRDFFLFVLLVFYLSGKEMYTNIIKGKEKIENTFLCYIVRV